MKKLLFLLLITHYSLLIATAQWVRVSNGMGYLNVKALAISGNIIFAGTYPLNSSVNGVYLSTDNGASWTQTLNNRGVFSLAVNGSNVFAGTYTDGVFLSTNNGTSWTQTPLNSHRIYALAINGNNIFAGALDTGLYLSTNNGTSWTQTSLSNQIVLSLAVNGNNIFAGTYANGVYLSTSNGTSWTQTSLNNVSVYSLAINGNNIFAGANNNYGVYLSTNNGTSWTHLPAVPGAISLAVTGTNVFAATEPPGIVYVSNDNGSNWTQRNEGLGKLVVHTFCILNNYIFAGSDSSVFRRPLGELIGIRPISEQIPSHYALEQNYPNPFNPSTNIRFALPKSSFAKLVVYDALGRELETLVNEQLNAGTYEVDFDGTTFPSGVYFYTLTAGEFSRTSKMVLMK